MSPTDWKRVKSILGEVLESPPGERHRMIDQRCGEDEDLRQQVEVYLREHEEEPEFLEEPTVPLDDVESSGPAPLEHGVLLAGRYEVKGLLGQGGMGAVYRARDTRLKRSVAIKVLHLAQATPSRQELEQAEARFEREAEIVASLTHPNILEIFDVGRHAGQLFAVTELVEGPTLAELLEKRGRLSPRKAVQIALQVALGLAAAQKAGLVHRDLKPLNLIVFSERVKILDFGIARPVVTSPLAARTRWQVTRADAMLLGTPGYMAPEQIPLPDAQEEPQPRGPDARTDHFALGVILYEMLTGQPAFSGNTYLEILHATLNEDPVPLLQRRPELSPALARVVHRCLEKEPDRRYQSASDLAFHLETLPEASTVETTSKLSQGALVSTPRPASSSRGWSFLALGLLLALISTVSLGILWWPEVPEPPRIDSITLSSKDSSPSAARDGRTVYFASTRDGRSKIYLRQLGTGHEQAITEGQDFKPRVSSSRQEILFVRRDAEGSTLYRAGNVGGSPPQAVVSTANLGVWSPDGTRIAFIREEERSGNQIRNRWHVFTIKPDGSHETGPLLTENVPLTHLEWSPTQDALLVVRQRSSLGITDDLLHLDLTDGTRTPIPLPEPGGRLSSPVWTCGGERLVLAQTSSATGHRIGSRMLRLDPVSGDHRTLFWLPQIVDGLDLLGPDRLVFDAASLSQSLGTFPVGSTATELNDSLRWLTRGSGIDRQPRGSADGRSVVFSSNRGGNVDLWKLDLEDGGLVAMNSHPADDWDPFWSPDGELLLWSSNRRGSFEIFRAEADGRNPGPIPTPCDSAENPSIARGSEWVVYSCGHQDLHGIRKVRLDGRDDQLITNIARAHPEVSPDGNWVVFHDHLLHGSTEIWIVSSETGQPTAFHVRIDVDDALIDSRVVPGRAYWLPDGKTIAFLGVDDTGRSRIFLQDFDPHRDTSPTRRVLSLPTTQTPETFGPFTTPEGRLQLAVSFIERNSNLMAASGPLIADPCP